MYIEKILTRGVGKEYSTDDLLRVEEISPEEEKAIKNLGVDKRYLMETMEDEAIIDECVSIGKEMISSEGKPDNLIVLSETSDYITPGIASIILPRLELSPTIPFYNLQGTACGSFPRALELAQYLPGNTLIIINGITSELYQQNIGNGFVPTIFGFLFGDAVAAISVENCVTWNNQYHSIQKHKHLTNLNSNDYKKALVDTNEVPHADKGVAKTALSYCDIILELMGIKSLEGYDQIFLHTGSQKIIDAFQSHYNLRDEQLEASRYTLKNYGNTTGCSLPFVMYNCKKKYNSALMIGISMGFTVDVIELS